MASAKLLAKLFAKERNCFHKKALTKELLIWSLVHGELRYMVLPLGNGESFHVLWASKNLNEAENIAIRKANLFMLHVVLMK
jgi:hypothetical protein